uniref:G_PROTEIN_RECEP_F1_2 domain-containing protein n=1 Tax=Strongyloides venezuelensis TaxID=75913 RepID=A0A0K0FUM6_STRVS
MNLPANTSLLYFNTTINQTVQSTSSYMPSTEHILDIQELPYLTDKENELLQNIFIGTLLVVLILFCVIGNLMVILAILLERDLRSRPQYYLIFSLAVADLFVGLFVTPLGAWITVAGGWNFGEALCDFWSSVDVLLCTASILHLVAIALDRYWSITDIYYVQNRTPKRITCMLIIIWFVSLLISVAPILGWKDAMSTSRVLEEHVCLISQEISYQVFSTASAFYIPLIAIICIYFRIMKAAKKRFKRERDRKTVIRHGGTSLHTSMESNKFLKNDNKTDDKIVNNKECLPTIPVIIKEENSEVSMSKKSESNSSNEEDKSMVKISHLIESDEVNESFTKNRGTSRQSLPVIRTYINPKNKEPKTSLEGMNSGKFKFPKKAKRKRRSKEMNTESRRERKAWRTLAIITGTFLVCWTPFFLVSLYRPICGCKIPDIIDRITLWLGYLNSAINPIIYTVFSLDFRLAFQRILKRLCFIRGFP